MIDTTTPDLPYPRRFPAVGTGGLVARVALPVSERRYRHESHAPGYAGRRFYVHAYLWASDAERDAAAGTRRSYIAFWQPRPFWGFDSERWPAEGVGAPKGPLLGDLHFTAKQWGVETVGHEAFHVSMWLLRVLVLSGGPSVADLIPHAEDFEAYTGKDRESYRHGSPEEEAAWAHGQLCDALHRWLWDVDADTAWTRAVVT